MKCCKTSAERAKATRNPRAVSMQCRTKVRIAALHVP